MNRASFYSHKKELSNQNYRNAAGSVCSHNKRLFDVGCLGRAGNEYAIAIFACIDLLISLVHVIYQIVPVKYNYKRFGYKIYGTLFHILCQPYSSILTDSYMSFYNCHISTIQVSRILYIVRMKSAASNGLYCISGFYFWLQDMQPLSRH